MSTANLQRANCGRWALRDYTWELHRDDESVERYDSGSSQWSYGVAGCDNGAWRDLRGVTWRWFNSRFEIHSVPDRASSIDNAPRPIVTRRPDGFTCDDAHGYAWKWVSSETAWLPLDDEPTDDDDGATCGRCACVLHGDGQTIQLYNCEETWCSRCVGRFSFSCDDCGEVCSTGSRCRLNNGEAVCERCFDDHYFECSECSRSLHQSNYGGDGMCETCSDENQNAIQDYSARAPSRCLGSGPHFYGVELETRVRSGNDCSSVASEVLTTLNANGSFVICKHDGTIGHGFEIVTCPASLDEQRVRWAALLDGSRVKSKLMAFSVETCGLHVHCSRAPLDDLTIAKIVCFVNARHNREFVEMIAGRDDNEWSKYKDKRIETAANDCGDRYEAVNLTNDHTIEFRIFKATLKMARVFAAIEFCDALIAHSMSGDFTLRQSQSRQHFVKFIRERGEWPHLMAFIDARWFGRVTEATKAFEFRASANPTEAEQ